MSRFPVRFALALSLVLAVAAPVAAQDDEPVGAGEPQGGDEDPANATDEEAQEGAADYYSEQPEESTPAPGAVLVIAVLGLAAFAVTTRRRR